MCFGFFCPQLIVITYSDSDTQKLWSLLENKNLTIRYLQLRNSVQPKLAQFPYLKA